MSQIPEDLLQKFMQMTGMSRKEAEKALTKSIQEMTNGPIFKDQVPQKKTKRGPKPKFDQENYPHFLPSDHIRKYTIRVSLKGITPTIWRKFECPSNISLRHLTELILRLMGWWNEHLNQIKGGHDTYYVPFYQNDPDSEWGDTYYQEEYMLSDLLHEKGKTVRWEYDFGDSWEHEIRLSSIDEYKDGESHDILFKGGKRACPPEDCCGVWGYQELLDTLEKCKSRKRLTKEEKENLEWAGWDKDYDPEDFDEYDCIDLCDYFSENNEDEKPVVTGGIGLIDHNLQTMAQEELSKFPPLYDDILSLAFRIRELEPWADLNDSDVYAIRMQDGSEIYVATMGNGGSAPEVQLYDGQDSFQFYIFLLKGESLPQFEILENAKWANYKSIMYQEPEDMVMDPVQYKMVEEWAKVHSVEMNDEHGYPFPQYFIPHRYPTMKLTDEELPRFKEALEAIAWFSQKVLDTADLTELGFKDYREYPTAKGGKVVPLIIKTADGYKVERTKLPGRINNFDTVELPDSEFLSLSSIKKNGTQFCRLIHIPGYLGSADDKDNACIPLLFLCIDKKTDNASISEPCELTETIEKDALRQYIKKAQEEGSFPQRIITDDPRTEALLKHFCHQLGIILELKRSRIPQLTLLCEHAYDTSFGE